MPPRRSRRASTGEPALDAGARDQLVNLMQLVETKAGSGHPKESWIVLAENVDASKSTVGGVERYVANQLSSPTEVRWGIEYRPDMDPDVVDVTKTRRLVYQGRTHDIIDAETHGREIGIELLTLARAGK